MGEEEPERIKRGSEVGLEDELVGGFGGPSLREDP
jgi:hypothetical protein